MSDESILANSIEKRPILLAMTGASGSLYGLRLLESLLALQQPVWFIISPAGRKVVALEANVVLPDHPQEMKEVLTARCGEGPIECFHEMDWFAPAASGSSSFHAMVIAPCSMGTLASITAGLCDNLIERAADVALKERRPLLLVPRETPLSAIHLENMLKLTRAGATILPAAPGFYHKPEQVIDLVDFIVARILDHLGMPQTLLSSWGDSSLP